MSKRNSLYSTGFFVSLAGTVCSMYNLFFLIVCLTGTIVCSVVGVFVSSAGTVWSPYNIFFNHLLNQ